MGAASADLRKEVFEVAIHLHIHGKRIACPFTVFFTIPTADIHDCIVSFVRRVH